MKKELILCISLVLVTACLSSAYVVRFCGANADSQHGMLDRVAHRVAVPNILMAETVKAVACGRSHTLMLTVNGDVYACGDNTYGQLGVGASYPQAVTPYRITTLSNIVAIAAGNHHSLFLSDRGVVRACGRNDSGQLGLEDTTHRFLPEVTYYAHAVDIDCGGAFSAVRLSDGTVRVAGFNGYGQLGQGDTDNRSSWVQVSADFDRIVGMSCGGDHLALWASGGAISSCGRNNLGQLGTGDRVQRESPTPITNGYKGAVRVACGDRHTMVLEADGRVCGCGHNGYGQLGFGDTVSRDWLTAVPGTSGQCVDLYAGYDQTFVRGTDGRMRGTGRNTNYELGLGDQTNRTSFTAVPGAWACIDMDTAYQNSAFVTMPSTAPNDFDGDGRSDVAVYWPETGQWFIRKSSDGQLFSGNAISWGWSEAAPVTGDFDGDGYADVAVFNASHSDGSNFYIDYSAGGADMVHFSGLRYAVVGDYDGDGVTDVGVFSTTAGGWVIYLSSGGTFALNWGWSAVHPIGLQH